MNKSKKPKTLADAVRALRQAAIIATSAADTLERMARAQNPDRFLRRWTAEQLVAKNAKDAKGVK